MTRLREIKPEAKIIPAKGKFSALKKCSHPKFLNLKINKEKITAFLDDNREVSIPISWITTEPAEKLKDYEIWDGYEVYFPKIKEVVGIETFIEGLKANCCDCH